AAAAAGMMGLGTVFNVLGPSAMVRFLALGRTAARYGERVTTHDATLRALSNLRVRLLSGALQLPYRQIERLRASTFLNRVTSDVDALDGLALRLVLPAAAGLAVIVLAAIAVGLLVHPVIGVAIVLGYGVGPTLIFLGGQYLSDGSSRKAQTAMQALRSRVIDLIAARDELIVFGQIPWAAKAIEKAAVYQLDNQAAIERVERKTGFWLDAMGWLVVAIALWVGGSLAQTGTVTVAQAAIGIFATLALSEAVAPVRRALSEIGRMRAAAKRIVPVLDYTVAQDTPSSQIDGPVSLFLEKVTARHGPDGADLFAPVDFSVAPGETVALTGRSGCGKSTLLLMAAGQMMPDRGRLHLGQVPVGYMDPSIRRQRIAMVPQRHALVAGTIAENLRLAAPDASDTQLWAALDATQLAGTVRAKGGLETRLGFRGAGLSGGEGRRLALARALLRAPKLLLLDEPTEGLDAPLAKQVLNGLRAALPDTAILMAAHRPEEVEFADRVLKLDIAPKAR
ncbi:MAG: ATP-binding cassette domain-containing protein, partial [Ahrensia sp.]